MIMKKLQESQKKTNYVSCIKINGIPILPPLITPEKSRELKKYKKQATKIEKRLNRDKELRSYIDELYVSNIKQIEAIYNEHNNTYLNIIEPTKDFQEDTITSENVEEKFKNKDVINTNENINKLSLPKLTCDIQASQYINNEFILFKPNESHLENKSLVVEANEEDLSIDTVINISPQFHLIRSNSYTLDTPSPFLVDHLKKQNESLKNSPWKNEHLFPVKKCWSSLENITHKDVNELNVTINNQFNENFVTSDHDGPTNHTRKIDVSPTDFNSTRTDDFYINDTSCTDTELKNISYESHISESESKLKQFITNNVPNSTEFIVHDKILDELSANVKDISSSALINKCDFEFSEKQKATDCLESSPDLEDILSNIPEEYSKQILEIFNRQKVVLQIKPSAPNKSNISEINQRMRERQDSNHSIEFDRLLHENPEKYSTPHEDLGNSNTNHQTIYYTINDSNEDENPHVEENSKDKDKSVEEKLNCSRKLLPQFESKTQNKMTKEEAASIIRAFARGFLVRRLLNTDNVQTLIQTIKDALLCAVQLHSENVENIDESDVELHRRLIQQVSAACYAFHDVFFNTSVQERMLIISKDRQKKKDKLKKLSANVSLSSNKSTPRPNSRRSRTSLKSF